MPIPIPTDVRERLDVPNYVHLSTLRVDGAPRNWVVWVGLEDEHILVCTSNATWKAKDMVRDPRVALSVTDIDNPYRMAAIHAVSSKSGQMRAAATWMRSPTNTRARPPRAAASIACAV